MAEFRDSTSGKFDAMEQRCGAISGQMGQLTDELVKSNTKVSDKMDFLAHELVKSNTRISDKMDVFARELIIVTDTTFWRDKAGISPAIQP